MVKTPSSNAGAWIQSLVRELRSHMLPVQPKNNNNNTFLKRELTLKVHGVARSRTRLSDFTFTFHFHALEKEMATHSSVLAWRLPGTGKPGGLPSMGSHRVGYD